MDVTTKNTSTRCDLHPPLSAIMYCDGCRQFLCRICAEVRPGGRVCSSCKKPCRGPSIDEFSQLMTQRQKAKESANEAKVAEARSAEQMARAKLDREARLKAEFAARKAALAQQQSPVIPPIAISSSATGATSIPQVKPPLDVGQATLVGTMYNPNAPVPAPPKAERDPLAKLGERAHINVIGKARWYMVIIGILTVLANGIALFVVSSNEDSFNLSPEKTAYIDEIKLNGLKAKYSSNREMLKRIEAEHEESIRQRQDAYDKLHAIYLAIKMVLWCFLFVGIAMIVLCFMCETYPRVATTAAFILYLLCTMLDLFSIRTGGYFGICFRIAALTALYNGMQAGQELHKMRVEAGEAT